MNTITLFPTFKTGAAILLSGFMLAACAPQYSPPEQVAAKNPSVTYKYRGDQELLQANQNAVTYCSQYRASPQTRDISNESDGSKTVVFECLPMSASTTVVSPYNPNLAYNYRTDQDLLTASRNADIYCMNSGNQRAVSTAVTNADGTKTVTFHCAPS